MEQKNYIVQIIIPVYNAAKTLDKCVESLLNQTFCRWQAIFVNDCSKDDSLAILEEYAKKDDRIKVISNEKNSGVSMTRNKALSMLDGKYTAFLDSDDVWEKEMLETLYNEAEKGFDIVQCRYKYDFEGGKEATPKGVFKTDVVFKGDFKRVYFKMLTGINMNHVWGKMIRTELIGDIRFDMNLQTAEDLDFCARLFAKAKSYSFVNRVLYRYYRGGVSLTGGRLTGCEKWKANCLAAKTIAKVMKQDGVTNPFYYILVPLRVYIITVSKILRTARDKIMTAKEDAQQ